MLAGAGIKKVGFVLLMVALLVPLRAVVQSTAGQIRLRWGRVGRDHHHLGCMGPLPDDGQLG